jgi:hypothetical protein
VRDLQAVRPWYERLFGDASFLPNATEAVWTLAEDRTVVALGMRAPIRSWLRLEPRAY